MLDAKDHKKESMEIIIEIATIENENKIHRRVLNLNKLIEMNNEQT